MRETWKIILLFLVGYNLMACTSFFSSKEDVVVTPIPLQSGLWLPEIPIPTGAINTVTKSNIRDSVTINNPALVMPPVYVLDAEVPTIMSIENRRYVFKSLTIPTTNGGWKAPLLGTTFFIKEQPLQLQTIRSTDTVTYTRAELKTKFHWPVTTLDDLDTLLQETSNWQEEGTDRVVVFYKPNCPQKLGHWGGFYKMALILDSLPEGGYGNPGWSDYDQQLLFNYTGELVYFFFENKATSRLERYVVVSMTPEQWTLRSLMPPYRIFHWNRIEEPSMALKELIALQDKRLAEMRKFSNWNCY